LPQRSSTTRTTDPASTSSPACTWHTAASSSRNRHRRGSATYSNAKQAHTPKPPFLPALAAGDFQPVDLTPEDLARMAGLITTYAELPLGTTDASVIAISERLGVTERATLDRRHFSVVRASHTPSLALLPECAMGQGSAGLLLGHPVQAVVHSGSLLVDEHLELLLEGAADDGGIIHRPNALRAHGASTPKPKQAAAASAGQWDARPRHSRSASMHSPGSGSGAQVKKCGSSL